MVLLLTAREGARIVFSSELESLDTAGGIPDRPNSRVRMPSTSSRFGRSQLVLRVQTSLSISQGRGFVFPLNGVDLFASGPEVAGAS